MPLEYLGSVQYIGMLWLFSTVVLLIGLFFVRDQVRMEGAGSWLVFVLFGWLGALATHPLLILCGIGTEFALPFLAIGMLLSIPVIHWMLPRIAPDFQIRTFPASLMLAFLVGLATTAAAWMGGAIETLIPPGTLDALNLPRQ